MTMNPFEQPSSPDPSEGASVRAAAIPGVPGLFGLRIASLGWYAVSTLFFTFMGSVSSMFGTSTFEAILKGNSIIWLCFSAATAVLVSPFATGRRGTTAEGVARAAMVLAIVNLVFDLLQMIGELGGPSLFSGAFDSVLGRAYYVAQYGLFAGFEVCFWIAITRSASKVPEGFSAGFYALLGVGSALAIARMIIPFETYQELIGKTALATVEHALRAVIVLSREVLVILVLHRLMRGGGANVAAPGLAFGAAPAAAALYSPGRDVMIGGLWLGGGLLVTFVSYAAASSSSGGGHYVITTGAIAYGLVRLVRGLMRGAAGS